MFGSGSITTMMGVQSFWQNKRVLITGGAGFIGSHLTHALLQKGAEVSIMDQITSLMVPFGDDNAGGSLSFYKENILDFDWPDFLMNKKPDVIFHLAGSANVNASVENPYHDFELNAISSLRLLEALRKTSWLGRFIFPSSAAVYGNPAKLPICESDPTIPISPYGAGKLTVERYVEIYSKLYGLNAATVRPFSIYGPGQNKLVIYETLKKIKSNPNEIALFGNGEQIRDFLYVEDLIEGMLLIIERGTLCGEAYNLASGSEMLILNLVNLICDILKISPKLNFSGSVRAGEPDKWTVDITKMKNLGFVASTDMQAGLKKTIEWFDLVHSDN